MLQMLTEFWRDCFGSVWRLGKSQVHWCFYWTRMMQSCGARLGSEGQTCVPALWAFSSMCKWNQELNPKPQSKGTGGESPVPEGVRKAEVLCCSSPDPTGVEGAVPGVQCESDTPKLQRCFSPQLMQLPGLFFLSLGIKGCLKVQPEVWADIYSPPNKFLRLS